MTAKKGRKIRPFHFDALFAACHAAGRPVRKLVDAVLK
jgi:hypothetical protein